MLLLPVAFFQTSLLVMCCFLFSFYGLVFKLLLFLVIVGLHVGNLGGRVMDPYCEKKPYVGMLILGGLG